jgi:hypothetical protein
MIASTDKWQTGFLVDMKICHRGGAVGRRSDSKGVVVLGGEEGFGTKITKPHDQS